MSKETSSSTPPNKLPAIGIIAGLSPEIRAKLAAAGQFVTADPGRYIAVQGQHHHALTVILSGKVGVTAHAHGDTVQLATLGAGHTVGEMSVLDPHLASANARVVDAPAELWTIEGAEFERLVEGDQAAGLEIIRTLARELCQRLRHDNETMLRREAEARSSSFDHDY